MWQIWADRVDGEIRGGIKVLLNVKQPIEAIDDGEIPMSAQAKGKRKRQAIGRGGIEGLDVGYSELKGHVEKSIFLLGEDEQIKCSVCSENVSHKTTMALVCPREGCKAASHIRCLAAAFLEDRGQIDFILPTSGTCPGCRAELQWVDLVKELSLRANGEKEVAQLMKKPKERKTRLPKNGKAMPFLARENKLDDEDDLASEDDLAEDALHAGAAVDDALPNDWYYQDDDDDVMSVTSPTSGFSDGIDSTSPIKASSAPPRLGVVIEDSEGDEAEILD